MSLKEGVEFLREMANSWAAEEHVQKSLIPSTRGARCIDVVTETKTVTSRQRVGNYAKISITCLTWDGSVSNH